MERRSELTELQIHIIDILSKVEHPHTFFKDAGVTGECITNWTSGARAPTDIVSIQDALKAVGYEVFVRRITEQTIDAVSEWIPCSERLPSEQGEYLVTVTYEGDTYVECLHYGKPTMANREVKGECFYDSDDEWGDIVYDTEAIAWMPLPKPYGERKDQ